MGASPSVTTPEARMMANMPIEYMPLQIGGTLEFRPDGMKVPSAQGHVKHESGPVSKYKEIINGARDQRVQDGPALKPVCPSCARGDSIGRKCRICGEVQSETQGNSPLKTRAGDTGHAEAATDAIVHLLLDAEALKRRKTSHLDDSHELYSKAQQRRLGKLSSKGNVVAERATEEAQASRLRAVHALKRISAMRAKLYEDDEAEDSQFGPGVTLKTGSALPAVQIVLTNNTSSSITIKWDSDPASKATMAAICRAMNGGKPISYNVEFREHGAATGEGVAHAPSRVSSNAPSSQAWSRAAHHTTALDITVDNLISNSKYEFRVRRIGWGPWSLPTVVSTAPGPPLQPVAFRATELSSNSVLLVWKRPEKDNGLPVVGYTLKVRRSGEVVSSCRYQGPNKFFLVNDLVANTDTLFELSARNGAGNGVVTTLIVRTLPQGSKDITPWEIDIDESTGDICYRHQKSGTISDHLPPGALLDDAASYRNKRYYFTKKLAARSTAARRFRGMADGTNLKITVPRNNLVQESLRALLAIAPEELVAAPIRVNFENEEGVDAGGIAKDWFGAVAKDFVSGPTCLICEDEELCQIDIRARLVYDESELRFWSEYVGVFLAKALLDSQTIGLQLSSSLIARLCGRPIDMSVIADSFPSYHQGLVWVLDNDVEEADLTFSASVLVFDKPEIVALVEGGDNLAVTEDNKSQYVECMVEWLSAKRYEPMLDHMIRGFQRLLPPNLLDLFSVQEIQLLLGGQCSIDIADICKDCEFTGGFSESSSVVLWLWEILGEWNLSQLSMFLAFCTGCAFMPVDGLQPPLQLTLMGGGSGTMLPQKTIDGTLPRAHTCFNQLVLPAYSSRSVLEDRLLFALMNTGKEFVMS